MQTLGLGLSFEEMTVGRTFRTVGRTVTDFDISSFVNAIGMTEVLFINQHYLFHETDFKRRLAPAALCYCLMEGLLVQATLQGTGMAFLGMDFEVKGPVFAGDTIHAECEVIEARRSRSRPSSGLVRTRNHIVKEDGEVAIVYRPLRMMKCRSEADS